ncbi:hypothetical protein CRG98_035573 [Punica granatum]|uniref:Uncharacterized protein n=1 Tax=Punica granatum TaxID=22663 RepID=A0A2I0IJX1_PUNGR|nr:hypothetical protein CRG98_035573 [Punica granatum]
MEVVVGVWRRKKAGMAKRTTKKRVVQRLAWKVGLAFLVLLLKAMEQPLALCFIYLNPMNEIYIIKLMKIGEGQAKATSQNRLCLV